jgi:hypothetical protein
MMQNVTSRRCFLAGALAPSLLRTAAFAQGPARHTFGWQDDHFLLDGEPFVIRSGEMHIRASPASTGATA